MSIVESSRFQFHRLRHELGNLSLLKSRRCDGAIISMHQSGTHWLKFMLASAMAEHYAIPRPRYNHANDIIGGSKDPRRYAQIPHLRSSHTIAPLWLRSPYVLRRVKLPPYVLLIRDIRGSLASNYRKWRTRYAVSFTEYLRGDPSGRRFNSDIWWCFRFLNAWGQMAALPGPCIYVARYESLVAAPHAELDRIARHLGLALSPSNIDTAVRAATKPAMAQRSDPARPPGAIDLRENDPLAAYDASDRDFVRSRCQRYLQNTFGYDYADWGPQSL
jgi:Sulfotransferase domain